MSSYDAHPTRPTRALQEKTRAALERFIGALARRDLAAVEAAVTIDVRAVSDGAGEYSAARHWIEGRDRVTRFFLGVGKRAEGGVRWDVRMLNGMPALVMVFENADPKYAPLVVQLCDVDDAGDVRALYSVLAPKKLTAIRSP
jgi:RNA polymerase sigma-70 factor (ECF subfamily)